MQKILVKLDIKRDAWNWWNGCNSISYGVNWKERISKKLQNKIVGKSQKQANVFLLPYLKKLYKKIRIEEKLEEAKKVFAEKEEEIFMRMEKVTGRKIYLFDDRVIPLLLPSRFVLRRASNLPPSKKGGDSDKCFMVFLTTFPRAPYRYPAGWIWLPIIWKKEGWVRTFVHELLHFQTYAYWQKEALKKLSKEEFENLKEALTVVLNEEFMDIMQRPDQGYLIHKDLRRELLKYWGKNPNFDQLIKYGIKIFNKYKKYFV